MTSFRSFVSAALLLGLAHSVDAQQGTWAIAGRARYVARYEGRVLRGAAPFGIQATLDADGHYEIVGPSCDATGPAMPVSGVWTRGGIRIEIHGRYAGRRIAS